MLLRSSQQGPSSHALPARRRCAPRPRQLLLLTPTQKPQRCPSIQINHPTTNNKTPSTNTNNHTHALVGIGDFLATKGVKKAAVQRALDSLAAAGQLTAKEFGKTKIYLPPQSGLEVLSKEELDAKKQELRALQQELGEERAKLREQEAGASTYMHGVVALCMAWGLLMRAAFVAACCMLLHAAVLLP